MRPGIYMRLGGSMRPGTCVKLGVDMKLGNYMKLSDDMRQGVSMRLGVDMRMGIYISGERLLEIRRSPFRNHSGQNWQRSQCTSCKIKKKT